MDELEEITKIMKMERGSCYVLRLQIVHIKTRMEEANILSAATEKPGLSPKEATKKREAAKRIDMDIEKLIRLHDECVEKHFELIIHMCSLELISRGSPITSPISWPIIDAIQDLQE